MYGYVCCKCLRFVSVSIHTFLKLLQALTVRFISMSNHRSQKPLIAQILMSDPITLILRLQSQP